jgi:hypothetical protein
MKIFRLVIFPPANRATCAAMILRATDVLEAPALAAAPSREVRLERVRARPVALRKAFAGSPDDADGEAAGAVGDALERLDGAFPRTRGPNQAA